MRIFSTQKNTIETIVARKQSETKDVSTIVAQIIARVQQQGDQALFQLIEEIDQVTLSSLTVSPGEIDAAVHAVSPELLNVMEQAKENILAFHQKQVQQGFVLTKENGVVMGQRVLPLAKVGVYVPGGTAAYPSTVLMDVLPAKIAGVKKIVMITPTDSQGKVPAAILAAASVAGVDEIYKVGGAHGVAALAYGTETIPKVDKIVGPGNIYVATAKKMVYGEVDIDMIAGPSDVLILADASANPRWLSADLLAQAEHDPLAQAILVTTEAALIEEVQAELELQLKQLPRKDIAAAALESSGKLILVKDLTEALTIANQIAPEHLELAVADPFALLGQVENAGSVFLGHHTPEVLGDYFAGPNHTLPTEGTARFYSPLSVDDFIKKSSYLYYPEAAMKAAGPAVALFAETEDLIGHARSINVRREGEK
ncbi:histidinol dehydrogenase [Enterococcus sp. C1]|jgi:histidinol dehydrogenase|uniref:histidinol dehydrogenase n=1 Tax=unclassified Enterococcus TaxID=2608891 RepID=UPI000271E156|nr:MULTISPECIES: histidinol dehydrogenase [unclassified Enterococcus]MBE9896739.1 histidinol dehydrogenase [Enterococcus casseliflavus]AUJ84616.1 histidinol dehydrogenase [Enterococcus sp. CR-Ec1]EJF50697.1 histidinol dehydrogenase [Enterococcus sp. C1]MBF0015367.1 histidinol dehydrogenase [Enterococcus casseliflavus]MBO1121345.1 histidinol dehydrogenase [Enterococcus casseliflavus]